MKVNELLESLSDDVEDIVGMTVAKATKHMKALGFTRKNPPGGSKSEVVYVGSNASTNYRQKTIMCRAEDGVIQTAR